MPFIEKLTDRTGKVTENILERGSVIKGEVNGIPCRVVIPKKGDHIFVATRDGRLLVTKRELVIGKSGIFRNVRFSHDGIFSKGEVSV